MNSVPRCLPEKPCAFLLPGAEKSAERYKEERFEIIVCSEKEL